MHQFFNTILISLSNNVDNSGASVAYSVQGVRISTPVNLWISVITFAITFCAALSGTAISSVISKRTSSIMAMLILSAIGTWMIAEPYFRKTGSDEPGRQKKKDARHVLLNPADADLDNSKHIDFKEATLLGIALSINNIGGGVSAGMMGLSSLLVAVFSTVFSFLAFLAGSRAAPLFVKWNISSKANSAAGLLLIAIGIEQIM